MTALGIRRRIVIHVAKPTTSVISTKGRNPDRAGTHWRQSITPTRPVRPLNYPQAFDKAELFSLIELRPL